MSLISDAARRHLRPEAYKTAEYQGWTNEETWSVALWFNNEYDHYQATRGMTSASELEAYARANYPADFTFAGQGGFDFDAVNWSELIEDIHTAKLASIKTAKNPQSGHGETELDYPEVPDEHDPEPAWPWELEEEDDTPRYAEGVNVWAQNRVAFTAPASEKSGACADGDHSSCRMDHLVGERPVFAGEDLCLCPEHGTGAPRGFQPDPYYDLSGACDDGDHDACRMTHPDFGAYCLCNDVEHYGSGGGRKATRRLATPKTAASYRITVYERPDYTETFDDFFVPSHEDLVRVLATEYGIHTDSLSGRASSNEGTYVEWGQGFPDSGEDYYLGRKTARLGWVDDFQGPYTSAYEAEGIGEGWIRPVEHSTPEPHEWKWDAFTYDTLPERGGGVAYSFEEAKQAVEDYVAANSVSGVQLSLGKSNESDPPHVEVSDDDEPMWPTELEEGATPSYKSEATLTDEEVARRDDSDLFL